MPANTALSLENERQSLEYSRMSSVAGWVPKWRELSFLYAELPPLDRLSLSVLWLFRSHRLIIIVRE